MTTAANDGIVNQKTVMQYCAKQEPFGWQFTGTDECHITAAPN
jgi:hypothetical protein